MGRKAGFALGLVVKQILVWPVTTWFLEHRNPSWWNVSWWYSGSTREIQEGREGREEICHNLGKI
jgi:hypothetical protein